MRGAIGTQGGEGGQMPFGEELDGGRRQFDGMGCHTRTVAGALDPTRGLPVRPATRTG